MKHKLLILVLLFSFSSGVAQVGINNPLPNPGTVLDLSGGANTGKGFLLPATDNPPIGIAVPTNGLIVMDTTTREFYIYNSDSLKWYSSNPWIKEYGVSEIFTNKTVKLASNLTVSGLTELTTAKVVTSLRGETDASYIQDVNGAAPPGVIVMWSGDIADIPYGWGLCDGSTYDHLGNAIAFLPLPVPASYTKSPNLRGRFIVGYDTGDADYDDIHAVNGVGGEKSHTLTGAESGVGAFTQTFSGTGTANSAGGHTHGVSSQNGTSGGKTNKGGGTGSTASYATSFDGAHSHTVNVSGTLSKSAQGASQAHENRPPYYTLAYIIKLKNYYQPGGLVGF